ncbi:MAG: zf-HC2 domain-containing protein [Nitrospiraceae bacterium]
MSPRRTTTKKKAARRTSRASQRRSRPARLSPGAATCLTVLRAVSEFLDDELPADLCQQIRRHIGACPNCERFAATLRHTLRLCRHVPTPTLTDDEKRLLRQRILRKPA